MLQLENPPPTGPSKVLTTQARQINFSESVKKQKYNMKKSEDLIL